MRQKYIVKIFVITFLFFGINNSFAENKVVYVDMNKILKESKVGLYVENELTKSHEAKLKDFTKVEEQLKKDEIDLVSQRNIMDRNEFEEKVRALNEKVQVYQESRRKWFDEIGTKRNQARNEVLKALDPIMSDYFQKNELSMILYKRNLAIGNADLDITSSIIDELNKKLPSIKIN
tara:strand:- start:2866 stop:3396 length:531 start_codon:yes stop_codon:yes gene_type:complete